MNCFVCENRVRAHIIRRLRSQLGPGAWARLCIPCAIKHGLDGVLLAGPDDRDQVEVWRAHRESGETDPSP